MRLLHTPTLRGLARSLGNHGLARGLATGGFARRLFGACHGGPGFVAAEETMILRSQVSGVYTF